jgi:hypothetical protein
LWCRQLLGNKQIKGVTVGSTEEFQARYGAMYIPDSYFKNIPERPFSTEIMLNNWNPRGWYVVPHVLSSFIFLSAMNVFSHRFAEALLHPKKE